MKGWYRVVELNIAEEGLKGMNDVFGKQFRGRVEGCWAEYGLG